MDNTRILLLILLGLLALLGAGLMVLAGIGDASVLASTGGVYQALETAGAGDNIPLRNDLYGVVLRLKEPWGVVHYFGFAVLAVALGALMTVWRKVR